MKKNLLLLSVLLIMSVLFNSCSDDGDNGNNNPDEISFSASDFVGCWEATDASTDGVRDEDIIGQIISINEDYSGYIQSYDEEFESNLRLMGNWIIDEEQETIEFVHDELEVEGVLNYSFVSTSEVSMTITDVEDGVSSTEIYTFEKIDCPAVIENTFEFDFTDKGTTTEV